MQEAIYKKETVQKRAREFSWNLPESKPRSTWAPIRPSLEWSEIFISSEMFLSLIFFLLLKYNDNGSFQFAYGRRYFCTYWTDLFKSRIGPRAEPVCLPTWATKCRYSLEIVAQWVGVEVHFFHYGQSCVVAMNPKIDRVDKMTSFAPRTEEMA